MKSVGRLSLIRRGRIDSSIVWIDRKQETGHNEQRQCKDAEAAMVTDNFEVTKI
jgi:hypothetical protein